MFPVPATDKSSFPARLVIFHKFTNIYMTYEIEASPTTKYRRIYDFSFLFRKTVGWVLWTAHSGTDPLFVDPKRLLLDMAQEHSLADLLRAGRCSVQRVTARCLPGSG